MHWQSETTKLEHSICITSFDTTILSVVCPAQIPRLRAANPPSRLAGQSPKEPSMNEESKSPTFHLRNNIQQIYRKTRDSRAPVRQLTVPYVVPPVADAAGRSYFEMIHQAWMTVFE